MKTVTQSFMLTLLLASSISYAQNSDRKERREHKPHQRLEDRLSDADFQKVQECHAQQNVDFPPKRGSEHPSRDVMEKIRTCLTNYKIQLPPPPHDRDENREEDFKDRQISHTDSSDSTVESSSGEGTAQ